MKQVTEDRNVAGDHKCPVHFSSPGSREEELTPAEEQLVTDIQKLLQEELYIWGTDFPITPPISKIQGINPEDISRLFRDPNYYNLDLIARGDDLKPKKLDATQLESITQQGQFSVRDEEGQTHIWALSRILQTGQQARAKFHSNFMVTALSQLCHIPHRIFDKTGCSVRNGLKTTFEGLWEGGSLGFVGLPSWKRRYTDEEISSLLDAQERQFILRDLEEFKPNIFVSGSLQIDFRLRYFLSREVVLQALGKIQKEHEAGWSKKLAQLRFERQKKSHNQSPQELAEEETKTFNEQLIHEIRTNKDLHEVDESLGNLIADHLVTVQLFKDYIFSQSKEDEDRRTEIIADLQKNHPLRSQVDWWVDQQILEKVHIDPNQRTKNFYEKMLKALTDRGLTQQAYIIKKRIEFEPIRAKYQKQLESQLVPSVIERIRFQIWNPSNWIITPTEDRTVATRAIRVRYLVDDSTYFNQGSDSFGWRSKYIAVFSMSIINNYLYFLGQNMLNGPLGAKALFYKNAFYPKKRVNTKTGEIQTNTGYKVDTFYSLLCALWGSVTSEINTFEKIPDSGILGKSISRVFNRLWNYVGKGFFGTALLTASFPSAVVTNIGVSLVLGITSLSWAPIVALLNVLFKDSIYDSTRQAFFSYPLASIKSILGIPLTALALSQAVIIHPSFATASFTLGYILSFLRWLYDKALFYSIVKRLARVPVTDTFLAKRISGPGVSSRYYYHVSPDLLYVAVQSYLEDIELKHYIEKTEKKVKEPETAFTKTYRKLFSRFGLELAQECQPFEEIKKRNAEILKKLQEATTKKDRGLISPLLWDRVTLPRSQLRIAITKCRLLVENYYTERIFPFLESPLEQVWTPENLAAGDWENLTKSILSNLFGKVILIPNEEVDSQFNIKVTHLSLSEHVSNIFRGVPREDLDKVETNLASSGSEWLFPCHSVSARISLEMLNSSTPMTSWYRKVGE